MSSIQIPESKLGSNAGTVPLLGFGTAAYPLVGPESMRASILSAIEVGYRHFDTAALYNSEKCLGEAVAEAVGRGIIKSRDELFITSKLWCSDAHPDRVLPALQNTLRNLGFEYLDLYLIHYPVSIKPESASYPFPKEDIISMDFKHVWEAHGGVSDAWSHEKYRSQQFLLQEDRTYTFLSKDTSICESSGDEPFVATEEAKGFLQGKEHTCNSILPSWSQRDCMGN